MGIRTASLISSPTKDEADYFSLEDPEDWPYDVGHTGKVSTASSKGNIIF